MGELTRSPADARLGAAVEGIWKKYRGATLSRVATLEGAVVALLNDSLSVEQRRLAERDAHKLAGSVGTFGFARGSELARQMELLLAGGSPLDQAQTLRLSELVVSLREELERPTGHLAEEVEDTRSLLLVIDEDREFTDRITMEAEGRGLAVRVLERPSDARAVFAERVPDAVILDPYFGGGTEIGLRFLAELTARAPGLPVLAVSAAGAFSDRVEAARLGARAFLEKPISPTTVVGTVLQTLQRTALTGTVLMVDDDPQILEVVGSLLGAAGLQVVAVENPRTFWDTLEGVRPDLLLLDIDMPYATGLELCGVVRNDSRWSTLPVIFLTARTDAETIQRMFAVGADDYVAKPVVGPELTTRVANRLERVRLYHRLAEVDALTGVANRRESEGSITHLISLAAGQKQPVSLALIEIDHLKQINDTHGHAVGDEVLRRASKRLRRALRGEDVIGRWGGEEFVIGAFGVDKAGLVARLDEVLAALRSEGISAGPEVLPLTFSAGVAGYPADGGDLATIYAAADAALYQAKARGCDRVVATRSPGERGGAQHEVDIVLVEDDPVLAELLLHAFSTHGYAVRWLQDGEAAVEALRGDNPQIRARVVLLDVNLPGRDGLGVLQDLARGGVTRETRVIMLTVRSTEAEVVRSLELGAFDHIAKPFSVPVLLRRINTALQGT